MAQMRINYRRVISQADSINRLSRELDNEVTRLENMLDIITNTWEGPASDIYKEKIMLLIAEMNGTKSDMSRIAHTIKTVARRIRDVDERMADAARTK